MIEMSVQDHLEVAHFMTSFPEGHSNRRLHGHSYVIKVTVRSEEETDFIIDFDELKERLSSVIREYDHSCANDWLGKKDPTMENMCRFFWARILPKIPQLSRITLERPTLNMVVAYEGNRG